MPPDLLLIATYNGEAREFIARDVPTGVFFYGFENTLPGAECFGALTSAGQRDVVRGLEAWTDGLLCRVMLEPRLTLEAVQRLGSARDELAVGYLWAIGYDVPSVRARDRLVPPRRIPAPVERQWLLLEDYEALNAEAAPNVKLALREFAKANRESPGRVWQRFAISEFLRDWRNVVKDDMKKRAVRAGSLPHSDIMAAVGREPS